MASNDEETLKLSILMAVQSAGFDGYKFCLIWAHEDELFSKNIAAHGIMADAFGVGETFKHPNTDAVISRIVNNSEPFIWSCVQGAIGCDLPIPNCTFACKSTDDVCTWGASVPFAPSLASVGASLCVFANGEDIERYNQAFIRSKAALRLAAAVLFSKSDRVNIGSINSPLTASEESVFAALSRGRRPKEIAQATQRSESTIHNHIESARARLGARTTYEALAIWMGARRFDPFERQARDVGLLDSPDSD